MAEVGPLKAIEVLLLVAAGVVFVVWQLRDVKNAQERSRAERARQVASSDAAARRDDPPLPP